MAARHATLLLAALALLGAQQSRGALPVGGLSLSPTTMVFDAPEGGPNPGPQKVTITNTNLVISASITWSATDDQPWLFENPSSGTLLPQESQEMFVSVDVMTMALTAGIYNGTITVVDINNPTDVHTVAITLNVTGSPRIGLSQTSLTFNAQFGGQNPPPQSVRVTNTGGGTLNWSASDASTPWLDQSPPAGSLGPGAGQDMSVSVDVTGLSAGTHNATITVSDPGASNTPQTITVVLLVSSAPFIQLNPTSLTFNAAPGGPNPSPQDVTVTNGGGGTLNWSATDNVPWLGETPSGGSLGPSASQTMSVAVDVTGLTAGTYNGTITVTAPGAVNTPQTIPVTLNVTSVPEIQLTPNTLTFNAPFGGPNPPSQNVQVANVGGGSMMPWTATDNAPWLSESPTSGGGPGPDVLMLVSVDVTGLLAGTHTATITVTAPSASNSPQTVFVTLNVSALPFIGLNPTSLTFDAPLGGPNPAAQTVVITNGGGGTLNWSATESIPWLTLAPPASGSLGPGLSENLSVSVDVAALGAGTYTGSITITAAGATNSPQSVFVTLNVNAVPKITINPDDLDFDAPSYNQGPPSQPVSITNSGAGTLNWSAASNRPWLAVAPASGALGPSASQPVSVSVNIAGLGSGTHRGTVTFSDPGSSNGAEVLAVALVIPAAPLPNKISAGHCGATGLEWLGPAALAWLLRRKRRRP